MTQKGKSVTLTLYSSPEGRYHWGGGCPYGQPLWGVRVRRLWCPGSEGSEGSACLWQAGSKGGGIALRAMSFIARLAGTGLHWRPPPSTTSWSPSPRKRWEARLKGVVLSSMLPAHPLSGGGWRAQRDGRGRPYGPLCSPGSEGSEGGGIALRAMSFIMPPGEQHTVISERDK